MANGGDPRLKWWSLTLMASCGLMFLAFFMPWWGVTLKIPAIPKLQKDATADDRKNHNDEMKKIRKDLEKVQRVQKKNKKWYDDKIPQRTQDKAEDEVKEAREQQINDDKGDFYVTMRIWGWSTGLGITAFIFSIVLLPIAIVPIFVPLLRNWIWIGYFVAAVSGLVLFILSLVWYFSSPGENVSGYVWQGVGLSPGPYMDILGSLATLTSGVLGGVFGLLHFLKTLKSRKPARRAARPVDSEEPLDFDA